MSVEPSPPSEQQRALKAIVLGVLLGAIMSLLARSARSAR